MTANDNAPEPLPSDFAREIADDVEMGDGDATRKLLAIISDQLDVLIGAVYALREDDDEEPHARPH